MTAASDFNVASNVFFILFPVWLAIAGVLSKYRFQCVGLLVVGATSSFYHLCWSHEKGYCAGDWTDSARDVWLARDVLTSHVGVLLTTSVLADQLWFKHSPHGERLMDAFILGGSLITFFLVWFLSSSPATTVLLVVMNSIVLGFALYFEVKRTKNHSWWWFFRGGLAVCMIITAGILKLVANYKEYDSDKMSQTDSYNLQHAFWHTLMAFSSFLFATMLDDLVNSAFGWTPTKANSYTAVSMAKP